MRASGWIRGWRLAVAAAVVTVVALTAAGDDDDLVAAIEAELIPQEGTETSYGIPLSLDSLPQFVDWWYTLVPLVEADPRYVEALSALVAPCCDDNTAFRCCCESDGQACNIIRSGKGLAAHLIHELDYTAESVSESVLQWFRFARPDYYVAAELVARGVDPEAHDLTAYGSCYRGMCSVAISQGGCGGMAELIEPAIEGNGS
ncbi:hypothetical protein ACFLTM_05235 [Candidatus Bipolaricaulota bacterium]